ncbi:hypothetical protein GALMADRAFT_215413 [Galerina marginata CBS 339.88]|uniref:Uncharacterized protein n=1 Tax=Galerina marginata (strain CBS 339.88) TaxID=685588 RepID=A0A067SGI7_GALM3|nr:hypothetical protein GALMADRAFT_215413 [Galerina marginata CBS 339.88]
MSTDAVTPADAAFLNNAQLDKVQQVVKNPHLNDSDIRKSISKEIREMGQMLCTTEANFAHVYSFLKGLDNRVVLKDGKVVRFAPEWKKLGDEYAGLMNESRARANTLGIKIQELLNMLLPLMEKKATVGVKQAALTTYIEGLDNFTEEAAANARQSLNLREGVIQFERNLLEAVPTEVANVQAEFKDIIENNVVLGEEFSGISRFLVADVQALKTRLEVDASANTESNKIYLRYIASMKAVYLTIHDAIDEYALSSAPNEISH